MSTDDSSSSPAIQEAKLVLDRKKQLLDLWAKQEDIAMHFNDLAMRLRLQALAGIGAGALVAGSIFTHQGQTDPKQIGVVLIAGGVIWAGIALLDVFYYQALLHGAVSSLKALEKHELLTEVNLSTEIENEVRPWGSRMRTVFYGIVFLLLVGGGARLYCAERLSRGSDDATSCVRVCASAIVSASPMPTPAAPTR